MPRYDLNRVGRSGSGGGINGVKENVGVSVGQSGGTRVYTHGEHGNNFTVIKGKIYVSLPTLANKERDVPGNSYNFLQKISSCGS